jgi:hypothetical protein
VNAAADGHLRRQLETSGIGRIDEMKYLVAIHVAKQDRGIIGHDLELSPALFQGPMGALDLVEHGIEGIRQVAQFIVGSFIGADGEISFAGDVPRGRGQRDDGIGDAGAAKWW